MTRAMDETLALRVLDDVAGATDRGVLLWRGDKLTGSDIDVVVLPGHSAALAERLRGASFSPAPQDPGRVLWRHLPDHAVVLDVLEPPAWPAFYPPLEGVVERAAPGPAQLPVASPADRVLIHAAEAVAGWPAEKVRRKLDAVTAEPGALEGARTLDPALAAIAGETASPGWGRAARAALRSRQARAALAARARERLGRRERIAVPRTAHRPGVLIALSGMDGAGKSTAALELQGQLEASGRPAIVLWTRLATDLRTVDRVARLARRLLRRSPAQQSGEGGENALPTERASRGTLVDMVWALIVVSVSVRGMRQAGRLRRRGLSLVCDRWILDSLVDLEIRYGRHRLASALLRRATPRPDLSVLLELDAETAAARKPGDQPVAVLATMSERYAELAGTLGDLVRVDATAALPEVLATLRGAAGAVIAPSPPGGPVAPAPHRARA